MSEFVRHEAHLEGVSAAVFRDELEVAVLRSGRLKGLRADDG
jgi:hypothetical protein